MNLQVWLWFSLSPQCSRLARVRPCLLCTFGWCVALLTVCVGKASNVPAAIVHPFTQDPWLSDEKCGHFTSTSIPKSTDEQHTPCAFAVSHWRERRECTSCSTVSGALRSHEAQNRHEAQKPTPSTIKRRDIPKTTFHPCSEHRHQVTGRHTILDSSLGG